MEALRQMKAMGLKVVYDLDDDLWGIQASNPAKNIFEQMLAGFGPCIEMCDVVTVSTNRLKTAVRTAVPRAKSKEIIVIPNAIDFNYMHEAPLKKSADTVVVGWGGSNTHSGDVRPAWEVLPGLLERFPKMKVEFVGMVPGGKLAGHPRVRMRDWAPVGEYASRFATWSWDIVLAPLDNNRFNRSKLIFVPTTQN